MKTNIILQGDALTMLKELPEKSINMCMTSPPYWALRDYGTDVESIWDEKEPTSEDGFFGGWDKVINKCEHEFEMEEKKNPSDRGGKSQFDEGGMAAEMGIEVTTKSNYSGFCKFCNAWKGQLGLEPTFDLYIKHLCDIFEEVKRVLRDDGTCWVNIGDTYASTPSGLSNEKADEWNEKGDGLFNRLHRRNTNDMTTKTTWKPKKWDYPEKCLVMIPFRFAIEMVNRGWILRNTIIWHKRNCMPSSVKDRFTVDFEYLFFFSKKKKYYFEQVLEPTLTKDKIIRDRDTTKLNNTPGRTRMGGLDRNDYDLKNKRVVWTINPQPFSDYYCSNCGHFAKPKSRQEKEGYFGGEDKSKRVCEGCGQELITSHFAIYPEELCEAPIKAGCPEFVCVKCGKPKIKEFEVKREFTRPGKESKYENFDLKWSQGGNERMRKREIITERNLIRHKPTCNCNKGFTSGIVLDPFFGAGTTGLVALKQNKKFIGIELNKEYIEIANKRLKPHLEQTKL